jgi:hypothetical protein
LFHGLYRPLTDATCDCVRADSLNDLHSRRSRPRGLRTLRRPGHGPEALSRGNLRQLK